MAEIAQKDTKEILPANYYDIFAMRLIGLTYKDIAGKSGYSESHIRHLFAKSGVLYNFWREWVEEKKKEATEEHMDMLFGHLADSTRRLILHAIHGRGLVSLEAIKTHFKYTVGEPKVNVKLDANVAIFNFSDWALAQAENIKAKQNAETDGAGKIITEIPATP